jgi:molybdopterin synthase sulfur carrier subunit
LIRVQLPPQLRILANIHGEIKLDINGQITQKAIIDTIEANYPTLRGTIRDGATQKRRPLLRFYACKQDLSHEPPDALLPTPVQTGEEPFLIIAAVAGG